MHVHVINHFFGKMREPGAVCRPDLVDTALIVLQVEKLAGLGPVQPVAVFFSFLTEIILFEFFGCLSQVRGDSPYVFQSECGGHRLATVRATKAIRFSPNLGFEAADKHIQSAGPVIFDAGKEAAEPAFVFSSLPAKGSQVKG